MNVYVKGIRKLFMPPWSWRQQPNKCHRPTFHQNVKSSWRSHTAHSPVWSPPHWIFYRWQPCMTLFSSFFEHKMPARTSDKPSKSVYATFILYRNFPAKTRHQIRASCSKNERTTQKLAFHWSNNHAMASRAHAATEKLYYYSTRHAKDWDEKSGQEDGSLANRSLN